MRIPWPVAKCAGLVMVALPLRFLPFPPELVGMLLAVAALLVPARPFHYALSGARYVCIRSPVIYALSGASPFLYALLTTHCWRLTQTVDQVGYSDKCPGLARQQYAEPGLPRTLRALLGPGAVRLPAAHCLASHCRTASPIVSLHLR